MEEAQASSINLLAKHPPATRFPMQAMPNTFALDTFLRSPHPLAVVESHTMMCKSHDNYFFHSIAKAALHALLRLLLRHTFMEIPFVRKRKQAQLC